MGNFDFAGEVEGHLSAWILFMLKVDELYLEGVVMACETQSDFEGSVASVHHLRGETFVHYVADEPYA